MIRSENPTYTANREVDLFLGSISLIVLYHLATNESTEASKPILLMIWNLDNLFLQLFVAILMFRSCFPAYFKRYFLINYINWALFLADKSRLGFWEMGEQRLGSISLVTCCNLGLDFMVILGQYQIKRF